ncbi:MAG: hypothetical protein O3B13_10330 [Planctomycetota bacterium]|nr:hypothetical protein [Planctomycetota bacterium]
MKHAHNQCAAQSQSRSVTPAEWLIVALGAALLFAAILNAQQLQSANDRSRWCTVWALVERGTYRIDEIDKQHGWTTIDKVLHEGHLYSSKPPLQSTAVAGIYWIVKNVFGLDLLKQTADTTRVILLIVNWLPMVLSFIVLARLLARSSENQITRLVALATFCCGSLVTGYATTLNNHSVAAMCLVFTLAPLLRIVSDDSRTGSDFALVGFWAALVCCHELPAALLGIAVFVMLSRKSVPQTVKWFVPAALIPLTAYFVTNWMATGGWKPFYMFYGTEKYLYEINGVRSYWHTPHGMDQSLDSPLTYFFHCVIGHHGIFSLSPIFLFVVVSSFQKDWLSGSRLRPAIVLGGALSVAVLGFYLTRTDNYNYGGNTFGLRWMIWLTPFWVLAMVPTLERFTTRRAGLALTLALLGVSVYSSASSARNPWGESWLFQQMEQAGWIDYSDPPPKFPFERNLHSWFATLPNENADSAWIEFTVAGSSVSVAGIRSDTLRLYSQGRKMIEDDLVQTLRVVWNENCSDEKSATFDLNVLAFEDGRTMAEQIPISNVKASDFSRFELLTLLRGMPTDREFRPATTRHIGTTVRKNAFRCQLAATQDYLTSRSSGRRFRYRCESWLTDELPFGVAQFVMSEYDAQSGELFKRRRFRVTAFGR